MSISKRLAIFVGGALLVLLCSYQLVQGGTKSRLILLAVFVALGGLAVIWRPVLGLFIVLLMSPLKTFGGEVLLISRLAGAFTLAIVLIGLLNRDKEIHWTGLEGPVLVMGAGMALSFFRTTNTGAVSDALLSLMSLYALMLLIVILIDTEKKLLAVALVFLTSGIYPIIQAFIQQAQGPSYVGQIYVRSSGTFSLSTGLGGFLIPIALFALALVFYPNLSRILRLFVIGIFAAGYIALIFSITRGALYGTFLGFAFILILLKPLGRKSGLLISILIAIVIFAATQQYWSSLQGRVINPVVSFFTTGISSDVNLVSRDEELNLLLPITLDNHFMGTGIGNYASAVQRYQAIYNAPDLPLDPHNILLYLFGEVGIITALGFFWLVFVLVRWMFVYYRRLKDKTTSISFYVYIGSISALIGYLVYLFTHSGLFTNEIWISMALLIVSMQLGEELSGQRSPA